MHIFELYIFKITKITHSKRIILGKYVGSWATITAKEYEVYSALTLIFDFNI